jgi:hypothetical protein
MPSKNKTAALRSTNVEITWSSVAGALYTIEYTTYFNVASPVYVNLATNVPGLAGSTTYTDNTLGAIGGPATMRLYRVIEQAGNNVSPNTAGMMRLDSCAMNYGLFGMPLMPYDTSIQMPGGMGWQLSGGTGAPTADQIDTWNGTTYVSSILIDLNAQNVNDSAYDGVWYNNKTGAASTDQIEQGEGFWITTRTAGNQYVYIEGVVPSVQADWPIPGPAGRQTMAAQPYPRDVAMNLTGADNLTYLVDGGTQGAEGVADSFILRACGAGYRTMFLGVDGQWWDASTALPSTEVLNPWEGFWIKRGTGSPGNVFTWTLPKPYANPPN